MIPEAIALMRGSMVMTDALEGVAVIGEFLPGIFGRIMQLCRCIPLYWALLSEEKPLAGSLICPNLNWQVPITTSKASAPFREPPPIQHGSF